MRRSVESTSRNLFASRAFSQRRALTFTAPSASSVAETAKPGGSLGSTIPMPSAADSLVADFIRRSTRQWASGDPPEALRGLAQPDPPVLEALRQLEEETFGPFFGVGAAQLRDICRERGLPV